MKIKPEAKSIIVPKDKEPTNKTKSTFLVEGQGGKEGGHSIQVKNLYMRKNANKN